MNEQLFPSTFTYSLFYMIVYGSVLLELRLIWRRDKKEASKDKGTMKLTPLLIFIVFILTNLALKKHVGFFPIWSHDLTYIGLGITLFGTVFRQYAIWLLGQFFTPDVQIQEKHELIKAGAYRLIRHPSYTGGMVFLIGIAITLQNWVAMILLGIIPLIGIVYRIRVEEAAMASHFGSEYREYKEKTWRLIPYIY